MLKLSEGSKRLYDGLANGSCAKAGDAKRTRKNEGAFHSANDELRSMTKDAPVHPLLQAGKGRGMIQLLVNGVDDDEEVTAADEGCQALNICSTPEKSRNKPQSNISKVDPLARQAEVKGINLLRMPTGMQRRLSNTSKYNKKNDSITWKIELRFHTRGGSCEGIEKNPTIFTVESSMVDSVSLAHELEKHLGVLPENSSTRSTLRTFASATRQSLLLFMKCLPCSSAAPKYYQIDPIASLAISLRGKTIIEYPTFEVAFKDDRDRFPLMITEIN